VRVIHKSHLVEAEEIMVQAYADVCSVLVYPSMTGLSQEFAGGCSTAGQPRQAQRTYVSSSTHWYGLGQLVNS
jgi:hypothetical protein